MQNELLAENPATSIRILGINRIGSESGNSLICTGRDIPWLQDTVAENAWTDWQVTYRDVVVLDENNIQAAVYNLTQHGLSDPANYAELKHILQDIAGEPCNSFGDSDTDGICDDGDRSALPGDNPCRGGSRENCDDNCPGDYNPNQADTDSDGIGDLCDGECYADCNCDTKVDSADLVIMKGDFLRTDCSTIPCGADCNADNKVDMYDLVIMKVEFLRTACLPCP